jgi:hypothetical protein
MKWTYHFEDLGIWEDNIEMDITEERWENLDWISLAKDGDQWQNLWTKQTFGLRKRLEVSRVHEGFHLRYKSWSVNF